MSLLRSSRPAWLFRRHVGRSPSRYGRDTRGLQGAGLRRHLLGNRQLQSSLPP